jgi:hypothetical protein
MAHYRTLGHAPTPAFTESEARARLLRLLESRSVDVAAALRLRAESPVPAYPSTARLELHEIADLLDPVEVEVDDDPPSDERTWDTTTRAERIEVLGAVREAWVVLEVLPGGAFLVGGDGPFYSLSEVLREVREQGAWESEGLAAAALATALLARLSRERGP